MPLTIDRSVVSSTAWGSVDKHALGEKLARLYASGTATKADIREVYAFVPDAAFGKDASGKPEFHPSEAKFPHHELIGNRIVLNRKGVSAAAGAANGAHGSPIPQAEKSAVVQHLRKHEAQLSSHTLTKSEDPFGGPMLPLFNRLESLNYPVPPQLWTPLMADLPDDFPTDLEDHELSKSLPQIFKSPGGKKWAARRFARLLAPHKRYGEVFSGSAAVYWAKDPAPEEILNDLRTNLIDTYRYIRDSTNFQSLFNKNWTPSRERFDMLRKWKPSQPVDKAYRYLWLSRASLLNREGEGYSPVMAQKNIHLPLKSRFQKWHDRLQGTTLLEQDAMDVLRKFDDPLAMFYIDPPYPKGRDPSLYPGHEYTMGDLANLIDVCAGLKGKFMMSLNPKSLPKEGLPKHLMVKKVAIWYPVLPTSHKALHGREGQLRMEVLIHNYPIPKGK